LEKGDKLKYFFVLLVMMLSTASFAEESSQSGWWPSINDSLSQIWESKDYELYIPVITWHNRNFYSAEKIDGYNEQPWGLGIGKYRFDEDGDWHALYAMSFQDSHHDVEPIAGYGFEKIWRPADDVRLGLGYAAGITMRKDMHYLPLPVIAPLASVSYKQLSFQSTYIPGGNGNGNILFCWLRWQLQ
jgi:lipid IVA palmitoyltransferase